MREYAQDLLVRLRGALTSLVPIVAIVAAFQVFVIGEVPEDLGTLVVGMLVVALGIAVFLQGLDLSVFPLGKSLASQFARKRALAPLLAFGFLLGAVVVIAEPALLAVAEQAEAVSPARSTPSPSGSSSPRPSAWAWCSASCAPSWGGGSTRSSSPAMSSSSS